MSADEVFAGIAGTLLTDPAVSEGRMFGADGLKVSGRVFAMAVKGELVVKRPPDRCAALVVLGHAHPFDPGHGRRMKEWIAVPADAQIEWAPLASEARDYVAHVGAEPRATRKEQR